MASRPRYAADQKEPANGSEPTPQQRRLYAALRDFLLPRLALCNRDTKNPQVVLGVLGKLAGDAA